MFRKSLKTAFVVLLVLAFSSAALALQPQDALSARPAESVYTVMCVNDFNGLLQYIFSQNNINMVTSLLKPDEAQIVNLIASFASQIPAKSVLIALGLADMGPFVQAVVSMPDSARSKLDKVANGSANGIEIVTLLLGDAGMMFAGGFEPEVRKGEKISYYSLDDQLVFTAKDDLLLISSSLADLEASIGAIENKENRLSLKRRFDSPNYWLLHMDVPMAAMFAAAFGQDVSEIGDPAKFFKAPLECEIGFTLNPGSFLMSSAVNILESFADTSSFKNKKPAKGANMFLAGGGKLLFALSAPLCIEAADMKAYPELAAVWNEFIEGLGSLGIPEQDIVNILNGSVSIAFGSDATIMGASMPGGYIALTGQNGAAANILGKLMDSPGSPFAPLKADGWDSLNMVDPAALPIPLLLGVKKETLFVGVVNTNALDKTPELPADLAKLLDNPLFGIGLVDMAGIWNWLRQEVANPSSLLSMTTPDEVKGILSHILEADLSVPVVKLWSSELETAFMEFTIVDVPEEKRLMPRLFSLGQMFMDR